MVRGVFRMGVIGTAAAGTKIGLDLHWTSPFCAPLVRRSTGTMPAELMKLHIATTSLNRMTAIMLPMRAAARVSKARANLVGDATFERKA